MPSEQEPEVDMTFVKEVRKATREVHKVSDLLVNAKFAFALSDETVWGDGLLAFYEIYKFLENNLPEDLLPKELHRTAAFEKDLSHLLGKDWKQTYEPRDCIKKYLIHLEAVNAKSKVLLFAYAYHMYLALMSGGQILQKKRMIARKLWMGKKDVPLMKEVKAKEEIKDDDDDETESQQVTEQVTVCPEGCAVTYFPENIYKLKTKLRQILNKNYKNFDEETKTAFMEESRNVFIYNGDVVRSVKGVNRVSLKQLVLILIFFIVVYLALKLARM